MKTIDLTIEPTGGLARRPVQLWIPDGWRHAESRALLLMHDGQNLFREEDSFDGIWGIVPALERLVAAGVIPVTAVAGVWNVGDDRWREYMPMVIDEDDPRWGEWAEEMPGKSGIPMSREYGNYIHDSVLPAVRAALDIPIPHFPVYTMGSSMGALISLELVTRFPETFTGAGCLSTHWTAADDPTVDYFVPRIPEPGRHRVYFDYGTEDLDEEYEAFQIRMDTAFRERGWRPGRDFVTYRFYGADHGETAWRRRLEVPLTFLLADS